MTPEKNTTIEQMNVEMTPQEAPDTARPLWLLSTGVLLTVLFAGSFFLSDPKSEVTPGDIEVSLTSQDYTGSFQNLNLKAKAAYVYDVAHGRALFAANEESQLPLASLTKVMTAIVATESLSYDSIVSVDASALGLEGDSGLFMDEQWRARDLLDFMLLVSSNDSASALASAAGAVVMTAEAAGTKVECHETFLRRMNEKAEEIGLAQTYFLNETGKVTIKVDWKKYMEDSGKDTPLTLPF